MNYDERDRIIFHDGYSPEKYAPNGIRYFNRLCRHDLNMLLEHNYFSVYPWLRYVEYWWFMEKYGGDGKLYLHGFTYSRERSKGEYGISIEGIGRDEPFSNREAEKVFAFLFRRADQFSLNPPWAWYD